MRARRTHAQHVSGPSVVVTLTGLALLAGSLAALPAQAAPPGPTGPTAPTAAVAPADLPPQEPGATLRTYQLGQPIDRLCTLREGQTPNVDRLLGTVDLTTAADFGAEDNFVSHVLATLTVPVDGQYDFRLTSDDGSRLTVGGDVVVDHDGLHAEEAKEGSAALTAGAHELFVEFFEAGGGQRLLLEWRPPGASDYVVVPTSVLSTEAGVVRVTAPGTKYCEDATDTAGDGLRLDAVNPGYDLVDLRPDDFEPMVSALAFMGDDLVVVTSGAVSPAGPPQVPAPGEVFLLEGVTGATGPQDVTWTKLATDLLNPMGVDVVDGTLWVSERDGLTELTPDADGDGLLEHRRHADWPYGGNFHEFAFGLLHDEENFYVSLSVSINNGGASTSPQPAPDRGTAIAVDRVTGEIDYLAGGLRTPNGMGWGPGGELLVMDNQGDWLPSSKLVQVEPGRFFNHYTNPPGRFDDEPVTPPVLWLPQNEIANSPSNPVLLEQGPFAGQMLFGDVTYGGLQRAFLEEVDGTLQGAAFRHTAGLEAGVNRTIVGPDGSVYVGGIGEAGNWGEAGKLRYGLQKLVPNGTSVFDMASMRLTENGFDVTYTEPLSAETASDLTAAYDLQQWRYVPTAQYGGPKVDEETLVVSAATLSEDRRTVSLTVDGRRPGHVLHLRSPRPFTAQDGEELLSTEAWYTMNEVPGYVAPADLGWYEAEEASLRGTAGIAVEHNGYSGRGFVDGFGNVGTAVTFTATVEEAGLHPVHLRYANGPNPFQGTKTVSLLVNGVEVDPWALPSTEAWNRWAFASRDLELRAGANTITIRYDEGDDGNVNLDLLRVGEGTDICSPVTEEGWTGLFDGTLESFSQWRMAGPGSFGRQADCSLRTSGGLGLLWHPTELEDYALHLDWKLVKDDNGGVFVGFPDPGNDPWVAVNQGYEIQIDATDEADRTTGAIYTFQGADPEAVERALLPVGSWNSYEIQVQDQTIKVLLNGVLVNDFVSPDPARDIRRGLVGIQNHGAGESVFYRDIRVRQLEQPPTAPTAPTGVTAVAAAGAARVTWQPVEGADRYTVTSAPGGRTCEATGATTCRVTGLTPGRPYTFTVVAHGAGGSSPASAPSAPVTPTYAAGTPGRTALAVSAQTSCTVNGRVALVVRVRNLEAVPADVRIIGPYGEVRVNRLAPGATHVSRSVDARTELEAGSVSVTGTSVRDRVRHHSVYRAGHVGAAC